MPRSVLARAASRVPCVLLALAAGCADEVPAPLQPDAVARRAAASARDGQGADEQVTVNPQLAQVNARLAAAGARLRVAKAELRMGPTWNGASSTVVFASDRARGTGAEWMSGDPERGGRIGVTYQVASHRGVMPFVINPDRQTVRLATPPELDAQIEEGVGAWRAQRCSSAPIQRVPIPAGTDPDLLDNIFRGAPIGANYAQTADIVESGWQSAQWFRNMAALFLGDPAAGDDVIGIAFTFTFVDENGNPTDRDRNGKDDTGLVELYYNARFVWDNSGLVDLRVVDFYSVIAHESGHALGLGHFGKLFVTKNDIADGSISLSEVKTAPKALMNAVYLAGRDEVTGTDVSSFCQIWARAR